MNNPNITLLSLVVVVASFLSPAASMAQHRPVVVRHPVAVRHPIVHTRLVVHPGHPLRRVLPATVVFRPAHRLVTVGAPLLFLPSLAWSHTVVTLPARERLVFEDSEKIERDEGWVDTNFGIDGVGNALFLNIDGKAKLNFAEVTFANGNVQVVDFNEQTRDSGIYRLLDFADGRRVSTVRILAASESDDAKLTVYLSK
jgi:hypothetical protein